MTKSNNKEFSLKEFDNNAHFMVRRLRADVEHTGELLAIAKREVPERELEIRREIRPLAVELFYQVIGTPKTFEEVVSDMEEQEAENDK